MKSDTIWPVLFVMKGSSELVLGLPFVFIMPAVTVGAGIAGITDIFAGVGLNYLRNADLELDDFGGLLSIS